MDLGLHGSVLSHHISKITQQDQNYNCYMLLIVQIITLSHNMLLTRYRRADGPSS
jgi:hypothetical protein